ncbi:hypothetical protein M422DRAFT_56671 [Sphaerobolus stellatus SS14]|uniref:Uncharacterized protein n=1 Tax=Sphaerobolus stellatus (strain SS14) TaxID=990650 RepID=A0A0C9UEI1_SPHS4|nr:hypothetical protein M422DRAFT_56671 [Sphaerobolus stellatus SS14]
MPQFTVPNSIFAGCYEYGRQLRAYFVNGGPHPGPAPAGYLLWALLMNNPVMAPISSNDVEGAKRCAGAFSCRSESDASNCKSRIFINDIISGINYIKTQQGGSNELVSHNRTLDPRLRSIERIKQEERRLHMGMRIFLNDLTSGINFRILNEGSGISGSLVNSSENRRTIKCSPTPHPYINTEGCGYQRMPGRAGLTREREVERRRRGRGKQVNDSKNTLDVAFSSEINKVEQEVSKFRIIEIPTNV